LKNIQYILLCGPSGIGKTTLIDQLTRIEPTVARLPAYTTRPKRIYETDGREYFFVSLMEFVRLIKTGHIALNDVRVFGNNLFAFSHQLARNMVRSGKILIVEAFHQELTEWQKEYGDDLLTVALLPADETILSQRLSVRGHDAAFIEARLRQSVDEIKDLAESPMVDVILQIHDKTTVEELVEVLRRNVLKGGV